MWLYGPVGLRELVETSARITGVRFPFEVEVVEVDTTLNQKVFESKRLEVWTVPLHHRTLCTGWLFREKRRPNNIRTEMIERYGMSYETIRSVKAGADLVLADGQRVPNDALVHPASEPVSYAFCSDTAPSEVVAAAVKGVTLLYHEATFTAEHAEEAALSFHSTAGQAADIARQAGAGALLMGHFSGRYADTQVHEAEARAVFPKAMAAEEGVVYEVSRFREEIVR